MATPTHSKAADFDLGAEWKKSKDLWDMLDAAWTLKSDPRVGITIMSQNNSSSKKFELTPVNADFFSEFERGRNAALFFTGAGGWKITEKQMTNKPNERQLVISGHYTDSKSRTALFNEADVWTKARYTTFSVIYPKDSKFTSHEAKPIVDRYLASVKGAQQ